MNWNLLIRQSHRWISMAFMVIGAAIFVAQGLGQQPAPWVFFVPLLPLFLMAVTGMYMFVLPYVAKGRTGPAK